MFKTPVHGSINKDFKLMGCGFFIFLKSHVYKINQFQTDGGVFYFSSNHMFIKSTNSVDDAYVAVVQIERSSAYH
jgi:hypothetical protein